MGIPYTKCSKEVQSMFGSIAKRYDLVNTVLSFGIHYYWRAKLYQVVGTKNTILDLCTGTGALLPQLEKVSQLTIGLDFSAPMLRTGRETNSFTASLVQGTALCLPFQDCSFDVVTVAYGVRNFEVLEDGLREIKRVLKKDGKVVILEFGTPTNSIIRCCYTVYSQYILPWIGGLISGNRAAYSYLQRTTSHFPSGERFLAILRKTGFQHPHAQSLTGGIAYIYQGIH